MIELTIVAFVAGVLTVAAPCILPLLPVIVGGSVLHGATQNERASFKHPLVIVLSLGISVFVFSLLLKATTIFLGVPTSIWSFVSGSIVILFGITLLFPTLWEKLMIATGWQAGANRLMARSQKSNGIAKDILLGAALGPVFNSCSPTYALIVAAVLPASFAAGAIYLLAYSFGLASVLLLIGLFGRVFVNKLKWLSNPDGLFKKIVGAVFIIVGLTVLLGVDKKVQTYVLENGWYDPIMKIEESFKK
ncbi:MAG TPA: cytochrome c biogenesis protein CcdA [Candidatus Saccharimonadales bacterium]|nr:cytochrome c biogenesis protein CcdA [Candidatus Saccharimonadales bacterium]